MTRVGFSIASSNFIKVLAVVVCSMNYLASLKTFRENVYLHTHRSIRCGCYGNKQTTKHEMHKEVCQTDGQFDSECWMFCVLQIVV